MRQQTLTNAFHYYQLRHIIGVSRSVCVRRSMILLPLTRPHDGVMRTRRSGSVFGYQFSNSSPNTSAAIYILVKSYEVVKQLLKGRGHQTKLS